MKAKPKFYCFIEIMEGVITHIVNSRHTHAGTHYNTHALTSMQAALHHHAVLVFILNQRGDAGAALPRARLAELPALHGAVQTAGTAVH